MSDMSIININSLNVQGLGNPIKRKKILCALNKEKCSIAFLQETYLSDTLHAKLQREWVGQVYFSSFKSHSRGVAILINKYIPFILQNKIMDPEGRFILISGFLYGQSITFLNVYAPNIDTPTFMTDILLLFNDHCEGFGVLAGDFNCTLNPKLDKSANTSSRPTKSAIILNTLGYESGMIDVWRELNPLVRDYTFFSNVYKSYSRIDYFFIPKKYLYMIKKCSISPIVLSDHAKINLSVNMNINILRANNWKFNISLLSDDDFKMKMRNWINNYIQDNNNNNFISPDIIWEAAKATFRGQIISFASFKKKQLEKHRVELENEVEQCERAHKNISSEENFRYLTLAKTKLNFEYTRQISDNMFRVRQKHYEYGNKPSKLLAHQLKKEQAERTIKAIKIQDSITYDPVLINKAFYDFYSKLYTSESNYAQSELSTYLDNITLPKLSESDQLNLNSPFTQEEVFVAIKSMSANKSPGPDGFPVEFYNQFWPELCPILIPMLEEFFQKGTLPESMNTACISVILKSGKDPFECSSYRPLSLLNADYKLITKLMARRLEKFLPQLIKPDQTGFIKNRYSSDNIRRLFAIINHVNSHNIPSILLSLDAEKAFDRVEWNYLFSALSKFNLGSNFLKWIKTIYLQPKAMVSTNGIRSQQFNLSRATRQGCCLSPLLFALAVEPLAESIRSNLNIKGIKIGDHEQKLSLYADDIIIYIAEPETSTPLILDTLALFGKFSGYKVNIHKSNACALHVQISDEMRSLCPFNWTPYGFKYLGINVTPVLQNLFKENYSPLVSKIYEDLTHWATLPVSMIGRVNIIRMNVLPKLNYLFQMIPSYLPDKFFISFNKKISRFIWCNKKPRIKFSTLMKPESMGGLGLPNFQLYYWSAQMCTMRSWILGRQESLWLQIEAYASQSIELRSLIHVTQFKDICDANRSFLTYNTMLAWSDCKRYLGIIARCSLLSPLLFNPDLPREISNNFRNWHSLGIIIFADLFKNNGTMKSFNELRTQYNIPGKDFFKYLQIRNCVTSYVRERKLTLHPSEVEELLCSDISTKGKISAFYRILIKQGESSFDALRGMWGRELGANFDGDTWAEICETVNFPDTSTKIKELNYKFIHKFYITPVKLHRMFPNTSPKCLKCKTEDGTFLHQFWHCQKLREFWTAIHLTTQKILNSQIDMTPGVYLLNYATSSIHRDKQRLLITITYFAKKCILWLWKSDKSPTIEMWRKQILDFLPLEKLTMELKHRGQSFEKLWSPMITFLENN